jgi:ribosomal protein S18 acetylase RimI-like enzyme
VTSGVRASLISLRTRSWSRLTTLGLSCVAEHRDSIVGFLLARRRQDEAVGYVDLLVVHPDQRGRGLGTALLRTAFVRFAGAGLREAQLGVASDKPASAETLLSGRV